ncbi:RAD3-like DEAD/DEAH box helicase [Tenacibaculum adriaticum]|uniref:RAD3-like DEAD/DEAH box helicase n=1 Tax=Tenacibaculum adriaticum TaxID=413713 RepID=A0A5S5DTS5_9FLAO|nr:DEAD/DEAH box helicase [Tenacibaculum adriaticum]TYP98252.1 RAD3-like DEAD/DEAH box helicase [Tenacibaculum adriaticum]
MIEELLLEIQNKEKFDFEETFEVYKECSRLIIDDETSAQKIIVNILEEKEKFEPALNNVLTDLIEAVGFYPYLAKENLQLDSTDSLIRQVYHHSDNLDKFLHEDQKHLLSLLNSEKNVVVSAPTSFGKSLLIEEFVASDKFKNIIIIQPTLALLDETRRKLKKYDEKYKIIVRTSQEPSSEKGNIYLFTAERVNEYKEFPHIDFIIIDEFYKLSSQRDDERADSLNNALHYILKTFNSKFYLLGPNIDNISEGFVEKYNAVFYKTKSSLVDVKTIDIYSKHKEKFDKPRKFKEYKEKILFDLLLEHKNNQSIIYCSSPNRVRYLSNEFCSYLTDKLQDNQNNDFDIIQWINENISKDWSLIKLLQNKIGIHDGALQKHITSTIIDYFNKGELNYLFCTTTIIEGVNTSAKNIIFFDKTKGLNTLIDYFDYSNIKGRAGRLMIHYTGTIFNFNPVPPNEQVIIDIPFYEQNPISDEVLINLEEDEVKNLDSEQYERIKQIPTVEKEIIKRNGVQVNGQRNIIETIREDINTKYDLITWTRNPNYAQLNYCLNLGWKFLMKKGESKSLGIGRLVNKTFNYGLHQSLGRLINSDIGYIIECVEYYNQHKENITDEVIKNKFSFGKRYNDKFELEIMEEVIMTNFQIQKHWFQYKIPKWLSVINSIQEFVCNEKGIRAGNYSFYTNLIENEFLRENLTILSEFGIPSSAIRKLEKLIPENMLQDDVIKSIRKNRLYENSDFLEYERNKLKET